ncbi:hydrogen gas-evolving membrane-bound hydrogenase subunit E [Aureimonas phyllosphaerae]|uniref:hydrogen gas-evolving membrane-bound hydrogenase subunit E n=1 Tax=Aureimonas phyllosphaerae TaxID=1166078 RepID=UPI003A5BC8D4
MPLIACIAVAIASALVARVTAPHLRHPGWALATVPAALFCVFLGLGLRLEGVASLTERVEWVPALGVALDFRLDGFSLLFCLLITGIGALVTIYAGAYFADKPRDKGARFLALTLLFMAAMLGTVLSDNLIGLYVFWELTSLVSFLLIGFDSHQSAARKAALQSLIATAGGGLCLFGAILLIGSALGTFSLSEVVARGDELTASPLAPAILVLLCLGTFTKSAQVPFHFWLPNAMQAPTPASAYLHSATMVKLGVYLLARFDQAFAGMPAFGMTLVVFGTATLLVGGLRAMMQSGFKGVLAQSTVGSLGLLVLLIGLGGETAAVATVGFILAHALYKAALFFCAGNVIHATGRTQITQMAGLGRKLPMTALAAAAAALSMAGLPPMVGFIAKELVFEAQLADAAGTVAIALAVVGNAAFVMVALLSAINPFWKRRGVPSEVHHADTPGLVVGPLVLSALGLLFGLAPGLMANSLVVPAASALAGRPIEASFYLWHGFTPMLALSAAVVALGAVLYAIWPRVHWRFGEWPPLVALLGDRGYYGVFNGILNLAERSTRILQNGDQRAYTATVVAATLAILTLGLVFNAPGLAVDIDLADLRIAPVAVLAFMMIGAVAATRTRSLLTALVSVGIVGFGSALVFLLNGAPDLALTQFSVEVLVVVILTALLLRIPLRPASTRTTAERRLDLALAGGFGIVVFVALIAMTAVQFDPRLSAFFAAASYPEAWGRNVVNVILVDFRAIDTLGEIAVVCFAALGAWSLLRRTGKTGGAR